MAAQLQGNVSDPVPSQAQVGESLLFNLFPEPTAQATKEFLSAISKPKGELDFHTIGARLHQVKFGVRTEQLGGWWDALTAAAKKVATEAGKALLDQAVAYIKTQTTTGNAVKADDVGKFADTLRLSLPLLAQVSAAALPDLPESNASGDSTDNEQKTFIGMTALSQVTQTVGRNFIQSAQKVLHNGSTAEKDLKNIHVVVSHAAMGTVSTLIDTIKNRVLTDPNCVRGASAANGTTTSALSGQAADSTAQQALHGAYTKYSHDVSTRGAQALMATAQQLHDKYLQENKAVSVPTDWWKNFEKAAHAVAHTLGAFSPSLNFNSNSSLANATDVQSNALTLGIQSASSAVVNLAPNYYNASGELEGFWNTLTQIASTVGNVVSTVAPVAAKILPLIV